MKITDIRRANLRNLIEQHGGVSRLSAKLGYNSPSFLVQQAGPNPTREVTEKSARKFEQALGLEAGTGGRDWRPGLWIEIPSKPPHSKRR